MSPREALDAARRAVVARRFRYVGDAVFGGGSLAITPEDLANAVTTARRCRDLGGCSWRLEGGVNLDDEPLVLEVRLSDDVLEVWGLTEP